MKRKFVDLEEKDMLEYCGKLYGYLTKRIKNERILGPPVNSEEIDLDYTHDIFIYNIPSECYECRLLPILFKPGHLHTLRTITNEDNKRKYAFATYVDAKSVQNACDLLNNYEIILGCKISVTKCRNIDTIYIGNVKVVKINLYRMLSKLIDILHGVKKITFYSVNNYGRYSLCIEFFKYVNTELGLRMLLSDYMFQIHPEIIVDCCFRSGQRTEPAVTYEWKITDDSRKERPKITVLNRLKTHYLQIF